MTYAMTNDIISHRRSLIYRFLVRNQPIHYYGLTFDHLCGRLDFEFNAPFYRELDTIKMRCKYKYKNLDSPLVFYSHERKNPRENPKKLFNTWILEAFIEFLGKCPPKLCWVNMQPVRE
jgi:hypothetical protein